MQVAIKPIQIMSFLLYLVVAVTVVNLFHRFKVSGSRSPRPSIGRLTEIDPIETAQCSMRGFRCERPDCDCETLCSDQFEAFDVMEGDDIVVRDQRAEPGRYCLPKGATTCNLKTSRSVFSASGWMCVPRNRQVYRGDHLIACKNPQARHDDANVLWDELNDEPARHPIENFYEKLEDGRYRYHCRCDSTDLRGNGMVNLLPFTCAVDYCLSQLENVTRFGWNGEGCDCGYFLHENPADDTSRCVYAPTAIESDVLSGNVKCMQDDDLMPQALFCPEIPGTVKFETRVSNDNRNESILDAFTANVLP